MHIKDMKYVRYLVYTKLLKSRIAMTYTDLESQVPRTLRKHLPKAMDSLFNEGILEKRKLRYHLIKSLTE